MGTDYQTLKFGCRPRAEYADALAPHPVAVVGAGPVGLAAAIDLAQRDVPVVLLDDDDTLATGSRAICFAKRTLEILDRLGCGERIAQKGVGWNVGKVFLHDELIYTFDLLPDAGCQWPAFVNLQQYYVEGYLAERASELPNLDLRWKNRVTGIGQAADHVALEVETPDGPCTLRARYVIAADGSKSPLRAMMGLDSRGRTFKDRFLIADVKMSAPFPAERWFWFDPPFHRNQSVLLHRQPDGVWRIDFQLGWDVDPVAEKAPERVIPRVRALLGPDAEFELEWVSVYTFRCQRMDSFRHGRVLFAGDAAHGVSPFGARGANSGVQDADNLAWKLALVLGGYAPDALLDTYAAEREFAADENIRHSTRATDFITPKCAVSRTFRDATLELARDCEFARGLVNSGRLSVPAVLADSPLNTADRAGDTFDGAPVPGEVAIDAPVVAHGEPGWLLQHVRRGFSGLWFGTIDDAQALVESTRDQALPIAPVLVVPSAQGRAVPGVDMIEDVDGLAAQRYDARPGTFYLLRPDQHVCARMRSADARAVRAALLRAIGAA
ncbi:FAD-dependent oxidoreductase [Burkholderia sp. TSV86]|uniref:FAD-dependent oxidoreductase n=1 Tax=Burkholderia sp. TSV86 TaxID=1385594 RepID=UPI000759540E|nr:FAD-dependent oxidoreductase [Burkholderia sp. TSV86]KVE35353.1 FAD-dependent oxidoreductase [Burkholderia sp. TSV86]